MLIVGCAAPPAVQPSPTQAMPIVTAEGTKAPVATEMPPPVDIATPQVLDASAVCPPETEASTLYVLSLIHIFGLDDQFLAATAHG